MVEIEEEDDPVDMMVRKSQKKIFPRFYHIPRWFGRSLIGMHSVRARGGATVWFPILAF